MAKTVVKKKKVVDKELAELKTALGALNSVQHNPVNWLLIARFLAPIITRWAIRAGLSYYARKTGKRINPKVRDSVSEYTAEFVKGKIK